MMGNPSHNNKDVKRILTSPTSTRIVAAYHERIASGVLAGNGTQVPNPFPVAPFYIFHFVSGSL